MGTVEKSLLLSAALLVGCSGDGSIAIDASATPDALTADGPVSDSSVDARQVDAAKVPDAMKAIDAAAIDAAPPLPGTVKSAAKKTCKTILLANKKSVSGMYWVDPNEGSTDDAFMVYCDMVNNAKGWTKVNGLDAAVVDLIRGSEGRQMLKCTDEGTNYIVSPPFTDAWSWTRTAPIKLAGTMLANPWFVNDELADCGADTEFNSICSGSWWGIGCSSGGGAKNKLYPGVLSTQACVGAVAAHTNGVFSICGDNDYKNYVVLVRSDK